MDILQAIGLGVLQGLTEFLPVSSSGHLVLAQQFFGLHLENALAFDVMLHVGTLGAVAVYFRRDLLAMAAAMLGRDVEDAEQHRRWVGLLALGTLPVALVGGLFADQVEAAFHSVTVVGAALLFTATLLLLVAARGADGKGPAAFGVFETLVVGSFQVFGLVPGISRSGVTLAGGLVAGIERETAAKFSFLLSMPAIGGATVRNAGALGGLFDEAALAVLAGTVAAGLTGWVAIDVMMRVVRLGRLGIFALYCGVLGVVTLVVSGSGGG